MADISNRTLAIMMVVAILVSLGGLFMSLDRLSKLQVGAPPFITGLVTQGTGYANVSIAETLSIVLSDSNINFGACGFPGGGVDLVLESNWTCNGLAACTSLNITPGSSCLNSDPGNSSINVTNDGNVGVNVTFTSDKNSSNLFAATGFDVQGDNVELAKYFGYRTRNYTPALTGACGYAGWDLNMAPALSINYTGEIPPFSGPGQWTEIRDVAPARYRICSNLSTSTAVAPYPATVLFYAKMNVSSSEPIGQKKATLIFYGSTVSKG